MKIELNLSNNEQELFDTLVKTKEMTPDQVVKQAVRVYQTIEKKLELGLITPQDLSKLLDLKKTS